MINAIKSLPQLTNVQAYQIANTPPVEPTKTPSLPIYASPVYKFDSLAKINIELIRDPSTGSVLNQIPPQQIVEKYRLGMMNAAALSTHIPPIFNKY